MIKLFSQKQQQKKDGESADESLPSSNQSSESSAASIRLQSDMSNLDLPPTIKLDVPDKDNLLNFLLIITPDEGFYRGGSFKFQFNFKQTYPHDPPKVRCLSRIYHPNIDLEGNVCLVCICILLREDWKPVLNLQSIVVGLQFLFLEPNPDDPLNKDAAQILRNDKKKFERNVRMSMRGAPIGNIQFDNVILK